MEMSKVINIKKIIILIILILNLLFLIGCNNKKEKENLNIKNNCDILTEKDLINPKVISKDKYHKIIEGEYSKLYYYIYGEDNEIVLEEFLDYKPLTISIVSNNVLEIRKGMGSNATLHKYYHIKRDVFSKEYQNILKIVNEMCVYVGENQKLIIRDIFDKTKYYKEFDLDLAKIATAILNIEFLNNNTKIKVIYISSNDNSTKEVIFDL